MFGCHSPHGGMQRQRPAVLPPPASLPAPRVLAAPELISVRGTGFRVAKQAAVGQWASQVPPKFAAPQHADLQHASQCLYKPSKPQQMHQILLLLSLLD